MVIEHRATGVLYQKVVELEKALELERRQSRLSRIGYNSSRPKLRRRRRRPLPKPNLRTMKSSTL